jgi:hypothetical protein
MAHDFTNIIAGIHSLSESLPGARWTAKHPFYEGLSLIKKSSLQASQLVQRMISLHLGQTGERNYHNLNDIANDLVELVKQDSPAPHRGGDGIGPARCRFTWMWWNSARWSSI